MHRAAERINAARRPDPLERGRFSDGMREFVVSASSAVAPDSFQVFMSENRADLVLIVSGLNTNDLHATWSDEWRSSSEDWRDWLRRCAFHVFHNGSLLPDPASNTKRPSGIRHCDG